jgi:hypothetical protein
MRCATSNACPWSPLYSWMSIPRTAVHYPSGLACREARRATDHASPRKPCGTCRASHSPAPDHFPSGAFNRPLARATSRIGPGDRASHFDGSAFLVKVRDRRSQADLWGVIRAHFAERPRGQSENEIRSDRAATARLNSIGCRGSGLY